MVLLSEIQGMPALKRFILDAETAKFFRPIYASSTAKPLFENVLEYIISTKDHDAMHFIANKRSSVLELYAHSPTYSRIHDSSRISTLCLSSVLQASGSIYLELEARRARVAAADPVTDYLIDVARNAMAGEQVGQLVKQAVDLYLEYVGSDESRARQFLAKVLGHAVSNNKHEALVILLEYPLSDVQNCNAYIKGTGYRATSSVFIAGSSPAVFSLLLRHSSFDPTFMQVETGRDTVITQRFSLWETVAKQTIAASADAFPSQIAKFRALRADPRISIPESFWQSPLLINLWNKLVTVLRLEKAKETVRFIAIEEGAQLSLSEFICREFCDLVLDPRVHTSYRVESGSTLGDSIHRDLYLQLGPEHAPLTEGEGGRPDQRLFFLPEQSAAREWIIVMMRSIISERVVSPASKLLGSIFYVSNSLSKMHKPLDAAPDKGSSEEAEAYCGLRCTRFP